MSGNSLINIGELSKPATVFIEKISNAVGVIYEPTRIKRKAKADAQASVIQALANLEVSEIEKRGLERLVHQEARKQKNIESITAKAINELPESADVNNLDEDWLVNFFDKCNKVSDEEMQSLWARVLAGEANKADTFSKRAINAIALLSKEEAQQFTQFCQFTWFINGYQPMILNHSHQVYKEVFSEFIIDLSHFEAIGLITLHPFGYKIKFNNSDEIDCKYFEQDFNLSLPYDKKEIEMGKCLFTSVGIELFKICGAKPNQKFVEYFLKEMQEQQIILTKR